MALSKSVETMTIWVNSDIPSFRMSDSAYPAPFVRIAFSRAFSRAQERCRGRFGKQLFTHTRNIPTRRVSIVRSSVDSPALRPTRACRMIDFDFARAAAHADASASAGFPPNAPRGFFTHRSFSLRRSPCRRARALDDARRPRLPDPRRDVDGARQSEKMPEKIFRAPTRARGSDRR